MPRKPGRESNRVTYPVEDLLVASFIMNHEEWLWRRPCAITGCDHRMGPKTDEPRWVTEWEPCAAEAAAFVVLDDGLYDTQAGVACPCHVAEILARDTE